MSWVSPQRGATMQTRRVPPSYKPWTPLPYQLRGVDFLVNHPVGGLPLRPGGRKTSITLAAFQELRRQGRAQTMLVIAPLRVCRQVWRQEAAKWEEFRDLRFSLLHGPKKDDRLEDDADVWLINPEGVEWLAHKYFGRPLPFDVVTIDELTKFKNAQAERSKALLPRLAKVPFRWGLTGSLAPNGYMDLFGQMLILDGGVCLGRYITHYRDMYFSVGWDGFSYDLRPGAERQIIQRLAPYWFDMRDEDYAQLPPLVPVPHELEMEAPHRKIYDRMKRDMIANLPEGIVTAANSAACYSKLSQMANGAVYVSDDKSKVSAIHNLKLDAIEDLLEELNGEPLLVAYEFNHDLDRLRERFGVKDPQTGKKVIPYLGKGTTAAQETAWTEVWNRGELPLLCAHPASAGHGLNMQGASAYNVCWFGITWDYELYDQFIRRIWRDGTQAAQIFNHLLLVKDTIDELKFAALEGKEMTQSGLLRALNTEIRRSADTLAAQGDAAPRRTEPVAIKLSRPGAAAAQAAQPETAHQGNTNETAPKPKGWGAPKGGAGVPEPEQGDQRERIQEQLQGDPGRANEARSAFTGAVGAAREAIQQEHGAGAQDNGDVEHAPGHSNGVRQDPEPPKTTRTRRSSAAAPAEAAQAAAPTINVDAKPEVHVSADSNHSGVIKARCQLLALAAQQGPETTEELFAMADELWRWASDPKAVAEALAPF